MVIRRECKETNNGVDQAEQDKMRDTNELFYYTPKSKLRDIEV